MKQLLKAISKHTCGMYNYAEVRDGVYYYVSTGKKIPEHCVRYPKPFRNKLKDGFYALHKYTCGDKSGCRIGKPSIKCIKRGIVSPRQCGKYTVEKLSSVFLSINTLQSIIDSK